MITKYFKHSLAIAILLIASACEIQEINDPNNPSVAAISANPTIGELNNVAAGTESLMRKEIGFYYDVAGIVGREYYFFTDADPRYTGEVLGKGEAALDNAGFYGTRPYAGRYAVILNANILLQGIQNTTAALTDAEKNGYIGFAKTCQAYSYLLALNLQYQNGIRIDVSDIDNLGPFLGYNESLAAISALLDEAYTSLTNAGSEFRFALSSGFTGFDTPATFGQFNRAIKARVELYRGNKAAALTALASSFINETGDLNAGPKHFYGSSGNDFQNPVYRVPNQAEALVVHNSFATDVQPGDDRLNEKTAPRDVATSDGLTGSRDVIIYSSLDSPIPIIRNEELILIKAEANIGAAGNTEAIRLLNIIRAAHNLAPYSGATTDGAVTNELLYNRRYSLFGEAHRWIDLRRYNMLNTLPIDRVGDDVWTQFPRPISEVGVQGG
jgi:starch-binding outer membrane protein, SusD/RagB family